MERVYERVVRVARSDLAQAERLAHAAAWLADKIDDAGCRAQSLRAMGHVQLVRGRNAQALTRYDEALRLFRALRRDVDVGRTLSGGALQARIALGQYDEAFASAKEARVIFERHGDWLRLARLDSNLGNILQRQNRFKEALTLYQRAHEQLARIGEPQDLAAVLINMAVCLTSLNDFTRAVETYRAAREYCESHDMPLLVAQADYNIAYLHYLHGEYTRALDLYETAQRQAEHAGDVYHRALCDLDRSEIYLEVNLRDEAEELAARALAAFDRLGMRYETAKAVTNLAVAASHDTRTERALELFRRARQLFVDEHNQIRIALVDLYQALLLDRDGRYADARKLCRHALSRFAGASIPGKAALCELLLARLERETGHLDAAQRACHAALARMDAVPSPILSYQAHFELGLIREAQHDRSAAYDAFEKARADLDGLRGHLHADDLKIAFLKDKLAVYESLVETALALGSDDTHRAAAFGYIEQAKSRSLVDLIAFRAAALTPRVDSALGDEVRRLREQVSWNDRQINLEETRHGARSTPRLKQLRQRTRALENQLARSLKAIRTDDEEFAILQGAPAVGLEQIRSALPAGTILLEYYQARGRLYACALGRERLDVLPLGSATAARNILRLLQFQLSKFQLNAGYTQAFGERMHAATIAHLSELYEELVAPVRDRLTAEHLVVVPHGVLHYLPFHALFDGTRFLIDEFTISYAPSGGVFRLCGLKPAAHGRDSLIMGVPDELTPYIAEEIQAVAAILPDAQVFMGADATAERLRTIGAASRFVHIATHGRFRRDNPMFSSIKLGSGPLSVFDLFHLRLSAELVTLSGCSTGLNAVVGGDELLGLVRGLFYAGASTVLLTLWDAYDMSTAEFMKGFYADLHSGATKAQALRTVMRAIREQYRHPFFWAPFVLIGQP